MAPDQPGKDKGDQPGQPGRDQPGKDKGDQTGRGQPGNQPNQPHDKDQPRKDQPKNPNG